MPETTALQREVIPLKMISLERMKVTMPVKYELHLLNNHIRVEIEFYADQPDEKDPKMPWHENVYNNFVNTIAKDKISGVEKSITKDELWRVDIFVTGFPSDITFFFETEAEATSLHEKLNTYLYEP